MRRLFARVALAAVAVQLLVSGAVAVRTTRDWIRDGIRNRGDDPVAALRRVGGATYASGIEAIRAVIPVHGTYLAVDADPLRRGELVWVRYDLAPRRGEYLGRLQDGALADRRDVPADLPSFVVVSYGPERAPRVEATARFLASCASGSAK